MLETALTIGLGGLAIYLVVGLLLLVPIHLRGLPRIDPACAGAHFLFRVLISPGLLSFWPLILLRWRNAAKSKDTFGALESPASPKTLRTLHAAATLLLAIFAPVVMVLTLTQRGEIQVSNNIPRVADLEPPWLRRGQNYGPIFPSVPADVYLSRNVDREMGLLFDFVDATASQPVAVYWASDLDNREVLPHDAIFLSIISGPRSAWVQFPDDAMTTKGYWIVYSFLTHETELFAVPTPITMGRSS